MTTSSPRTRSSHEVEGEAASAGCRKRTDRPVGDGNDVARSGARWRLEQPADRRDGDGHAGCSWLLLSSWAAGAARCRYRPDPSVRCSESARLLLFSRRRGPDDPTGDHAMAGPPQSRRQRQSTLGPRGTASREVGDAPRHRKVAVALFRVVPNPTLVFARSRSPGSRRAPRRRVGRGASAPSIRSVRS
jgi:hypothetical protein